MTDFVHLHAHSTYSILDAWGQPDAIVDRVVEAGLTAHALTDHDSVSGHWKFQKAAKAAGIKPIFGVEIRVVDDLAQREWRSEEGRRFYPYHLGLIARNQEGYKNLMQLTSLAWTQGMGGRGKFMPVVTWADIAGHNAGLIGTSGCLSSKLSRAILGQIPDDPAAVMKSLGFIFEPGMLFYEWQNIGLDAEVETAKFVAGHPRAVVTHDVHFPTKRYRETQNIMSAIMRYKKVVGPDGQGPMHEDCYLASADEVWELASGRAWVPKHDIRRAMANTVEVAEMCEVELPHLAMVRYPHDGDKVQLFKDMITEGWRKRNLHRLPKAQRDVYLDRIKYEVDIIVQKDYVDYFLIIADICHFCIREDILKGPARGSSAGSLVAWCLQITEVDPIYHGLIFERFIDMNRMDLPDIDLDFPDFARERIHEYLQNRYGRDKVTTIGTWTTFKAKSALDAVARVYGIPQWVPNKIKPYIPDRAHGDVRSDLTLVDVMEEYDVVKETIAAYPDMAKAADLEGQFRAMGVHPAGVVVSSVPVEDVAAVYEQPGKGRVIGLDGWDVEAIGAIKIDILGISGMTVITDAREAIKQRHGIDVDFYTLPLDDQKTLEGFHDVDVLGIFQFNGKATKNTLRQVKPTTFNHLVDINTLSRPGAMLAGTTDDYIKVHLGLKEPESIHPIVDRITGDTHLLVLYQEQVLRIMREFGGLSWAEAGEIRKFLSKRMGVEILQQFWDQFVAGAKAQGIDEEVAKNVWLKTSTFGAYGFNRSHSVSYSILAYWQMWVKQHYPTEFYYAVLANENDKAMVNLFISEARRKGVPFLPVDPNKSSQQFGLEGDGIRYGLMQINGIGAVTANAIIDGRPHNSWDDITKIRGIGARTVEVFKEAFARGDDLFGIQDQEERLTCIRLETGAIRISTLMEMGEAPADQSEVLVAGYIISRNFRQESVLRLRVEKGAAEKSSTVIVYIRDESGESFPVTIPGKLAGKKQKEIWEGESNDVYLIRGRLPSHGKFMLCNGIANTGYQDRRQEEPDVANETATQLQLALG